MTMDYSISLNGVMAAQRCLEHAARRIAAPIPLADVAADLIAADQAEVAVKANLRVISVEREIEGEILNLFA